jgi:hypothetical protein
MRITIDTNEPADSGEQGKLGSLQAGIRVIDAGPAPVENIRRMSGLGISGGQGAPVQHAQALVGARARTAELPLNPLRAGARGRRESFVAEAAVVRPEGISSDGGRAAHVLAKDESPPVPAAQPAAAGKSGKSRRKR